MLKKNDSMIVQEVRITTYLWFISLVAVKKVILVDKLDKENCDSAK